MSTGYEKFKASLFKPVAPKVDTKRLVLTSKEFFLMQEIALAYPEGRGCLHDDRLVTLVDHKFVKQGLNGKWLPTEEGILHLRPDLGKKRA